MPNQLRIVLAQLNFKVGDIQANLTKHIKAAITARDTHSAHIIVFPELSLCGYPAEDLLLRPAFISECQAALKNLALEIKDIYCLVGHPYTNGHHLYNGCSLLHNGKIIAQYAKQCLPNYGVFDECRYFTPGETSCIVPIHGIPTALMICEDLWRIKPVQHAVEQGAKLILSPNASPFEVDKHEQRVSVLVKRTQSNHVPIVYVNHIGGQDELIFDGGSMVINEKGHCTQFAGFFNETLLSANMAFPSSPNIKTAVSTEIKYGEKSNKHERIYQALVLSLRDYINKNHFPGVLIGLSGGIDSALTAAIAVDALDKTRVKGILLPSRYTAEISNEDALTLANNLEIKTEIISIENPYHSFLNALSPLLLNKKMDVTEENIQARCRAIILMAASNQSGNLLLTTGNRSEIAVGYCTLYGDMAGGFAVLKDVPKTLVYELAKYRNQIKWVIPKRSIDRAPTAELAPNQKDEDSLPPYEILDKILDAYLNRSQSIDDIAAQGFEYGLVEKIVNMIHKNEYKRKQAALGPHIHHRSFIKDWRYPVTNGFKG